jgi:hypothetical protein
MGRWLGRPVGQPLVARFPVPSRIDPRVRSGILLRFGLGIGAAVGCRRRPAIRPVTGPSVQASWVNSAAALEQSEIARPIIQHYL